MMTALQGIGLLKRYEVAGKRFFAIGDDWKKQHCHRDEKKRAPRPGPPPDSAKCERTVLAPGLGGATPLALPDQDAGLLSPVADLRSPIADTKNPPAAAASAAPQGLAVRPKKPKATVAEQACRAAISARIDELQRVSTGYAFEWNAAERKAVVTLANLGSGIDPAEALNLISVFVGRMKTDAFYAKNFKPSFIASQVNPLRMPPHVAVARPGAAHVQISPTLAIEPSGRKYL
jgi:hypothetical protein